MKTKLALFLFIFILSCETKKNFPGNITAQRLLRADEEPGNWMSLGRSFMQQHHSPLKQINTENIKALGFAWQYETKSNRGKVNRGLEATPIVVDGVLYSSGAWSQVYAVDAKTGKEIWRYDPKVDGNYARKACCDVVNRGVQVWNGKVFVGTLDGYLVCLDASNGKEIWKQDTFTDRKAFYTITGPPQIAKDKVVIGNSGAEFGVRGYITAYDIETGKFAWRFYTVPGDPANEPEHEEMVAAAKTWDPNSDWKAGGGGTVWGEYAYDPNLNLIYVGTGNSSPYPIWHRSPSGGDNLFLVSILAINPDNGKLKWYYQTTPGEIWDFTCTSNIVLADMEIEGRQRQVLMQAPKNGFFYVIDRATGELISAEKYVPVNWASHVDLKTGRPVLTEHGWYKDKAVYVFPGPAGGHNWFPMSYNPTTGLVYIPTLDLHFIFSPLSDYKFKPSNVNVGVDMAPVATHKGLPDKHQALAKNWPEPEGEVLKAWDPVTQKEVWRVQLSSASNGGVLSTDGNLVFQGTPDGRLVIYKADTGEKLKEIETGTGIMAAPVTYTVDGEQYVAVMAGYGGVLGNFPDAEAALNKYTNTGRILAFKLKGTETPLPSVQQRITKIPEPPDMKLHADKITLGKQLYEAYCIHCHFIFGEEHRSEFPDLSMMTKAVHDDFDNIVLKGKLSFYGMANFSDVLTDKDADALHQYLISIQKERFKNNQLASKIR